MGFFEKAKNFMGGHGVKVEHVVIERQDPKSAAMAATDSVVKGRFRVIAEKDSEVLSMRTEIVLAVMQSNGMESEVPIGKDVFPASNVSRSDDMVKYPYTVKAGDSVEDYFSVLMESDINTALAKYNLNLSSTKVYVKTTVDVKGSPFDPSAKDVLRIT